MLSDWLLPLAEPENIVWTAKLLRAVGGFLLAIAQFFFMFG